MTERDPAAFSFQPALQLMAGRLLGVAATFVVPVVLVRVLDPVTFGTYKQLFLLHGTLFGIAQLGMAESLYYFLPLDRRLAGGFIANAILCLLVSGALTGLLLGAAAPAVASFLGNPLLLGLLPLLGGYLFLALAAAGLEIVLVCQHRYGAAALTYALCDALRAVLLVVPVLVSGDLRWLLAGAIVLSAGRLAVLLAVLRRSVPSGLRPAASLLRRQLAYGAPFQLAVMVELLHASLHQYAVAIWFDTATFAIYAVGCLQIPLVDVATTSAGNVLMVGLGDARQARDAGAARRIWDETTRRLALVLVPIVALMLLVADDLIRLLFTDAYARSVPIFMVWTGAALLAGLPTDSFLRAYAQVRCILALHLVRLALVTVLVAVAVSASNLVGAVLATAAAALAHKLLALVRVRRLLGVTWGGVLPFRDLAAIACACGAATVPAALVARAAAPGMLRIALVSTVLAMGVMALYAWLRLLDPALFGPALPWRKGHLRPALAGRPRED